MTENKDRIKNVIAVCNEVANTKILFIDKKIQKLLEEIANCQEVYNLISDCLNGFNRDKEFERAFVRSNSGKYGFLMPKEEVKQIALVFCILGDINTRSMNLNEIVGKYFVNENGEKDYLLFVEKVIIPFRNLIAEAFNISTNITTVETIENMEESEEVEEGVFELGNSLFTFDDNEDLDRVYDVAKGISSQIYDILFNIRKQTVEIEDSIHLVNSIVAVCDKKDFDTLYSLVMGLKYSSKGIKDIRFLVKEIVDLINTQVVG